MTYLQIIMAIVLIAVVIATVYGVKVYYFSGKPKKEEIKCDIDLNELITALGGSDNVIASEHSHSKLIVRLGDSSLMDVEAIKALGASGIVESQNNVSMIFGKVSEVLDKELIDELHLLQ